MITLEFAKQAFDSWRANKANGNTQIPVKLWDMVRQLLLTHKKTKICRVLRISSNQIKRHCITTSIGKNEELRSPQADSRDFVEAIPTTTTAMSELTLKGNSKSLHLCLPTSALREILPVLVELL